MGRGPVIAIPKGAPGAKRRGDEYQFEVTIFSRGCHREMHADPELFATLHSLCCREPFLSGRNDIRLSLVVIFKLAAAIDIIETSAYRIIFFITEPLFSCQPDLGRSVSVAKDFGPR